LSWFDVVLFTVTGMVVNGWSWSSRYTLTWSMTCPGVTSQTTELIVPLIVN